jgi:hypothetical protein
VIAAASAAGCGEPAQPPLALDDGNATAVAAELLVITGRVAATVRLPASTGFQPSGLAPGLDPRVQRTRPSTSAEPLVATTAPCANSGTMTTFETAPPTVAFSHCQDYTAPRIDGDLTYALGPQDIPNRLSLLVGFHIAAAFDDMTLEESGGYEFLSSDAPPDRYSYEFAMTADPGDELAATVTAGGAVRDRLTLSGFSIDIVDGRDVHDPANQTTVQLRVDLASTRLGGRVGAMTTDDLWQRRDPQTPRQFPYRGQIMVTGANNGRLQLTIQGDETFVAPAAQGQIELRLDLGSGELGAPSWVDWPALAAAAIASR